MATILGEIIKVDIYQSFERVFYAKVLTCRSDEYKREQTHETAESRFFC